MEQQIEALIGYKTLSVGLTTVQEIFGHSGRLTREGATFHVEGSWEGEKVIYLHPEDIETVLNKFLTGLTSSAELQEWANFLIMCDAYEVAPHIKMGIKEAMLEILHGVASPEINRPLNNRTVQSYLRHLRRKFSGDAD